MYFTTAMSSMFNNTTNIKVENINYFNNNYKSLWKIVLKYAIRCGTLQS